MNIYHTNTSFTYVTGGILPPNAASYIERKADYDLLAALLAGEYCYLLDTRQMGKSSLMVRTGVKLRERGVDTVVLDLSAIGQNVTVDLWYAGLLARLGAQLQIEDELIAFWRERQELGGLQRFVEGIRRALTLLDRPLVIFVDEIDAVRSLPFSTDELFIAIRECYNRRTTEAQFQRLSFCLIGVATPTDLIQDTRLSPFNIGTRIALEDFTVGEAALLAGGLEEGCSGVQVFRCSGIWCRAFGAGSREHKAYCGSSAGPCHLLDRRPSLPDAAPLSGRRRLCQAVAASLTTGYLNTQTSEHLNTRTPNTRSSRPSLHRSVSDASGTGGGR